MTGIVAVARWTLSGFGEIAALPAFMSLRDIGLFLRSARTDAKIQRMQPALGTAGAIEAVYAADPDPWASASPFYRYQRRKYEVLASLLPPRRFQQALDLGCGFGLLSRHLPPARAPTAERAHTLHADWPNRRFEAHDLLDLPQSFAGGFNLVAVADVLYYLSPLDDARLKALAARVADLLAPGGICLLANHYFFGMPPNCGAVAAHLAGRRQRLGRQVPLLQQSLLPRLQLQIRERQPARQQPTGQQAWI
ncbi:MAG: hypothetical protein K2Z80_34565 [Xanthobacteraceae bacterium]|nr:hypothetical protein [Xanthobacteraceae bacterium]